jgi:hypothetical protein
VRFWRISSNMVDGSGLRRRTITMAAGKLAGRSPRMSDRAASPPN